METIAKARTAGLELLRRGVLASRIERVLRFSPPLNIGRDALRCALDVISDVVAA